MSTALTDIQNKLKQEMAGLQDTIAAPSGNRITVNNGNFVLPDGKTSAEPLSVVVLGWRWINRYYKAAFNPNQMESPECYAINAIPTEMVPMGGSDQQHTACEGCAMNQFGSKGRGKACRNSVRVALASAGDPKEVLFLDVPPTSIKAFSDLIFKLNSSGTHPLTAVTQVALDTKVTYSKFQFEALSVHSLNLEKLDKLRTEAEMVFNTLDFEYD